MQQRSEAEAAQNNMPPAREKTCSHPWNTSGHVGFTSPGLWLVLENELLQGLHGLVPMGRKRDLKNVHTAALRHTIQRILTI